ncbi:hypothetical protein V2605_03415 [Tenacibaculum maritimum]|uniref:hypothetical protein n=1 Tax=Tenacibaculum maritimum TaxID=107401 RepID=UPI0012E63B78|nr:hypothetical protein [Tenacibaculum maritimum]CAA0254929.1 exported hypothetical protein [Tenacibaculum maritimum]
MKKLLITILLLTTTLSSFSQSIKKDSVTIAKKTLKSIVKESRKCDSVKVAFTQKSLLLEDLIKNNVTMFNELEQERIKRNNLQLQLQKTNKPIESNQTKKNGWLYGTGGVVVGVVLGVLVSK